MTYLIRFVTSVMIVLVAVVAARSQLSLERGIVNQLLGHRDPVGPLMLGLPELESFVQTAATSEHAVVSKRNKNNRSAQRRRVSPHEPCECPENLDTLSPKCIDRRLTLTQKMLEGATDPSPGIQTASNELRSRFKMLQSGIAQEQNQTADIVNQIYSGVESTSGVLPATQEFSEALRAVAAAMTQCVNSIWLQAFQVNDITESAFEDLERVVTTAVSNISDWFSAVQAKEEAVSNANLAQVMSQANDALQTNISAINAVLASLHDGISGLDALFGKSAESTDDLAQALGGAADQLDERLAEAPPQIQDLVRTAQQQMDDQAVRNTISQFKTLTDNVVSKLRTSAAAKFSALSKSEEDQIRAQDADATKSVLGAAVRATQTRLGQTGAQVQAMQDAISVAKRNLQVAIDSAVANATQRVNTQFVSRQKTAVDRLDALLSTDANALATQQADAMRKLSQVTASQAGLSARVNTETDNIVQSLTATKLKANIGGIQDNAASSEKQLNDFTTTNDLKLTSKIAQSIDQLSFDEHKATADESSANNGLEVTVSRLNSQLSNALDSVRTTQSEAMYGVLDAAMRGVANNIPVALDSSRLAAVTGNQRDSAAARTSIAASTATSNATAALTGAETATQNLLVALQNSTLIAHDKQSFIATAVGRLGSLRASLSPTETEDETSAASGSAADSIATSEDSTIEKFKNINNQAQQAIRTTVTGAAAKVPAYQVLSDAADTALPEMQRRLDAFVESRQDGADRAMSALNDSRAQLVQSRTGLDSSVNSRTADIGSAAPFAQAAVLQATAETTSRSAINTGQNLGSIAALRAQASAGVANIGIDALEAIKSFTARTDETSEKLKIMLDSSQPGLAAFGQSLKVKESSFSQFFQTKDAQVANAAVDVDGLLGNWSNDFGELKSELSANQSQVARDMETAQVSLMAKLKAAPNNVSVAIQNLIAGYQNTTALVRTNLTAASAVINSVAARDTANASQTATVVINATADAYTAMKTTMTKNRKYLSDTLSVPNPLKVNSTVKLIATTRALIDNQDAMLANATVLVANSSDSAQALVQKSSAEINRVLTEAAAQVARNRSFHDLYAATGNRDIQRSAQRFARLDTDLAKTVNDYRGTVQAQNLQYIAAPDRLFDEIVAVQANASSMLGRVTQSIAERSKRVLQSNVSQPALAAALMRHRITDLVDIFGSFMDNAGPRGLFRQVGGYNDGRGNTTIARLKQRLFDTQQTTRATGDQIAWLVADLNASRSDFNVSSADLDARRAEFDSAFTQWTQTELNDTRTQAKRITALNLTQIGVQNMTLAAIKTLVSSIEKAVIKSIPQKAATNLTNNINKYLKTVNLSSTR